MSEIIVYHGGTEKVESPVCKFGRRNLDYGQGFYVTDIRKQAADWATQVADRRKEAPIINRYRLNRDAILREARCKVFVAYDKDWLQFIVASRRGEQVADNYDYIEGGVANDRVIDTVENYMAGLIDEEAALGLLAQHQPYHQICITKQEVVDCHMHFLSSVQVKAYVE